MISKVQYSFGKPKGPGGGASDQSTWTTDTSEMYSERILSGRGTTDMAVFEKTH